LPSEGRYSTTSQAPLERVMIEHRTAPEKFVDAMRSLEPSIFPRSWRSGDGFSATRLRNPMPRCSILSYAFFESLADDRYPSFVQEGSRVRFWVSLAPYHGPCCSVRNGDRGDRHGADGLA